MSAEALQVPTMDLREFDQAQEVDAPEAIQVGWFRKNVLSSEMGVKAVAGITGLTLAVAPNLVLAESASADTAPSTPNTPAAPAPTVTMHVQHSEVSVSDAASKKIIFVEDEHFSEKGINKDTCRNFKTFWNSGRDANGKLVWFKDHNGRLCRDSHLKSGWIKVGGGETGRNCGNEASPIKHKVTHGEIVNVAHLNTKFTLEAKAVAKAAAFCGSAEAEAEVKQRFNLKNFLRRKGPGMTHVGIKLYDKAVAKAKAEINCSEVTIVTPPTPPETPTKNGTEGQGTITPGQPGGSGSGGTPGNTGEGAPCYDDNSTVNGDLNPNTSGDIMYGTADQFGNCVGQAQPMENA